MRNTREIRPSQRERGEIGSETVKLKGSCYVCISDSVRETVTVSMRVVSSMLRKQLEQTEFNGMHNAPHPITSRTSRAKFQRHDSSTQDQHYSYSYFLLPRTSTLSTAVTPIKHKTKTQYALQVQNPRRMAMKTADYEIPLHDTRLCIPFTQQKELLNIRHVSRY